MWTLPLIKAINSRITCLSVRQSTADPIACPRCSIGRQKASQTTNQLTTGRTALIRTTSTVFQMKTRIQFRPTQVAANRVRDRTSVDPRDCRPETCWTRRDRSIYPNQTMASTVSKTNTIPKRKEVTIIRRNSVIFQLIHHSNNRLILVLYTQKTRITVASQPECPTLPNGTPLLGYPHRLLSNLSRRSSRKPIAKDLCRSLVGLAVTTSWHTRSRPTVSYQKWTKTTA